MEDKKIAYKVLKVTDSGFFGTKIDAEQMAKELNRLGDKGWDLVTSLEVNFDGGSTKEALLILKKYK